MIASRLLRKFAVAAGMLAISGATCANACGTDTDCPVGDRSYRIALPDRPGDAPLPGLVFLHGYRGTAEGVLRNRDLTAAVTGAGFALIAAQAAGPEWSIPNIPGGGARPDADELAYFDALAEDVARRFSVDRSRTVVAGFSSGAMAVWHLACQRGDRFAGFVPLSGTFWAPVPETCPTVPRALVHFHGLEDPVVPLEGRVIEDARQGDVPQAFALIAGLSDYRPVPAQSPAGLDCTRQVDSEQRLLELCLFHGGHEIRPDHLRRALGILVPN